MILYIPGVPLPKLGPVFLRIEPSGAVVEHNDNTGEDIIVGQAIDISDQGRLFDADLVCKECRRVAEEYDGIYPDCSYCPVHLAPTIIPASKGGA